MPKTINPGVKPEEPTAFTCTCPRCGGVYEFELKEQIGMKVDWSGSMIRMFACPCCSHRIEHADYRAQVLLRE